MIIFPDISPEIFSISAFGLSFSIRWYALSYIAGILLAWRMALIALHRAEIWPKNLAPMSARDFGDLLTWMILGILLGGRFGYVLFYQPAYYFANPFEIVMIWTGGMAFHGGLLGVVLAAFFYFRRNLVPYASGADVVALSTPMGLFLGRVANFINAELWGRPTDLPWGVAFPGQAAQACGQAVGLCARHPSQLYEAALEGLLLGVVLAVMAFRYNALKRPGLITGAFFLIYGLSRCLVELFRQPDAQFQSPGNPLGYSLYFDSFGLTMGQVLSLPMVLLGAILILRAFRKL